MIVWEDAKELSPFGPDVALGSAKVAFFRGAKGDNRQKGKEYPPGVERRGSEFNTEAVFSPNERVETGGLNSTGRS